MKPSLLEEDLRRFVPDPGSPLSPAVQQALLLARGLQERAAQLQTPSEKRQQSELERMLQSPQDKATLVQITDQAFRAHSPYRAAEQFTHILDVQGVPRFFSPLDRALIRGFQSFGAHLPGVAVPMVQERMRRETANVIVPAEPEILTRHLRERIAEGLRMNVNLLGEAILGEEEAHRRLQANLQLLHLPEVEMISVKISTLYSQISPLARGHTITTLCDRLEILYRTAADLSFTRGDGSVVPKFVYLDMEEYRDMTLTAEVFLRTLDRSGMDQVKAGIALQAYVPDSFRVQRRINEWARRRVASGGAPVTLRVVKGANREMEIFEASIRGWPQAPYRTKRETDANYKRMIHEGMRAENIPAVRLGIASHNLFDLAYAWVLASEAGALEQVQFEMLEGMANHQRRALAEVAHTVLLYAPICSKEQFINAIGYLIRRLDENTGPDNFLRHAFKIHPGSPEWSQLEQDFVDSFAGLDALSDAPRRNQDRRQPPPTHAVAGGWDGLVNEPDTDFALPHHAEWAQQIAARWQDRSGPDAPEIPLVIAGEEILEGRTVRECLDPSRAGMVVGRYRQASGDDIDRAVACAVTDEDGWCSLGPRARFDVLGRVAEEIRRARADLIGAAMADGGKTVAESDPEVSEAVDFVELYRSAALYFQEMPSLTARPKGVVVVVSPWNFPIAIPCGGIAAALAAGNTVILKPASDTVLVAWELCRCFWRAGVSMKALQLLPCSGASEGKRLVSHASVNAVILTGGTETAFSMLHERPEMALYAETGGKNAAVVTALADRDQAIKNVVHSAFSHAGQKCSATSLLLLEAEVYDDERFKRSLCDAVNSLHVGAAWDLKNKMGPLIRPPSGALESALKVLDRGESWAVVPRPLEENPCLWSPGVKYGVQPGSRTHFTELFGPVLGVMRFNKLDDAISLVNQTGYGLTSGLESLDEREQARWKAGIRAGNLYINRPTTGAIVLRQPFGGIGKSAFGPGIKAGGPNYVALFMNFADADAPAGDPPTDPLVAALCSSSPVAAPLLAASKSYSRWFREEFGIEHDHFRLIGQDNIRRYLSVSHLRIRVHPDDSAFAILARVCAARIAGCHTTVSVPPGSKSDVLRLLSEQIEFWGGRIEWVEENDEQVAAAIRERQVDRVRCAAPGRVSPEVHRAAADTGVCIVSQPVLAEGRVELLWYLQEQSISFDYHRYGNLGARAGEDRAKAL